MGVATVNAIEGLARKFAPGWRAGANQGPDPRHQGALGESRGGTSDVHSHQNATDIEYDSAQGSPGHYPSFSPTPTEPARQLPSGF